MNIRLALAVLTLAPASARAATTASPVTRVNLIAFPAPGVQRHGAFDMFQSMSLGAVVMAQQGVLQDPRVRLGPSVIAVPAERVPQAVAALASDRVDAAPLPELAARTEAAPAAPLSTEEDAAAAARLFDGAVRERASAVGAVVKAVDALGGAVSRLSAPVRAALASLLEGEAGDYEAVRADEDARRTAARARRAAEALRREGHPQDRPGQPVQRRAAVDIDGRGESRFILVAFGLQPGAPDFEESLAAATFAANRGLNRYLVELNRGYPPAPGTGWPAETLKTHLPEDMRVLVKPLSSRALPGGGIARTYAVSFGRWGVNLDYEIEVVSNRDARGGYAEAPRPRPSRRA
jgi:hypothetical protein